MEQKKLFYFQMSVNFFKSESLLLIVDESKARNLDLAHIELIYIKLILASLANNGLIKSSSGELTPQKIKALIEYTTGNYRDDIETINKALTMFEELDLIIFNRKMQALLVKDSKNLTMSKNEDSQRKFDERRKNAEIVKMIQQQSLEKMQEEEKETFLLNEKINNEFLPGLLYCGYTNKSDIEDYKKVFEELTNENYTIDEITKAIRIFIKRSLDINIEKIEDKKNYLLKTLDNIIKNEVRSLPDIYTPIINEMLERKLIEEDEAFEIIAIMKKFLSKYYSSAEIYEQSKLAINKASITSRATKLRYVNVFDKVLDELLKKQDLTKKVIQTK